MPVYMPVSSERPFLSCAKSTRLLPAATLSLGGIRLAKARRTQMASKTYAGGAGASTGRAARDDWSQFSFAAQDRANPRPVIVGERLSSQAAATVGFHMCAAIRST